MLDQMGLATAALPRASAMVSVTYALIKHNAGGPYEAILAQKYYSKSAPQNPEI
jgi:DMSO/TMAO reductase YedYZ molybdopterin-dependent catalytic subunit